MNLVAPCGEKTINNMEDFTVNFNVYGEYETFERWCQAQFSEKKTKTFSYF